MVSTVRPRPSTRPAVRVRAIPPLDPPFDDESRPTAWTSGADRRVWADGQLALDLPAPTDRNRSPAGGLAPRHRMDPPPEMVAAATTEAARAARRFLRTCLEVLNGYRPAGQLRPLLSPTNAVTIIEQLGSATMRLSARSRGTVGTAADPVRPRRLRVCEPLPGVLEAAAALSSAERTWAMAFRLERRRGAWIGTAAQVW